MPRFLVAALALVNVYSEVCRRVANSRDSSILSFSAIFSSTSFRSKMELSAVAFSRAATSSAVRDVVKFR